MRARVRDGLGGRTETGFTMIELVASLTIFTIGILALVDVMTSSFSVVASSGGRTNAVALATKEAETVHGMPYANVASANSSQEVDKVIYTITRTMSVVDASYSGTTYTGAYKKVDITVSWSDKAGTHSVSQSTLVYPGGLGTYNPTTTTVAGSCTPPTAPSALGASQPVSGTGAGSVLLSWSPPALLTNVANYVIDYSPDHGGHWYRATARQLKSKTSFIMSGLAAGASYDFRVASKGVCGDLSAWSPVASTTTSVNLALTCSYGQATITPAAIKKATSAASSYLTADANVVVNTSGNCSNLSIRYTASGGVVNTVALTQSGNVFATVLNGTATAWDLGVHSISIVDGLGVTHGSMDLTVCSASASSCP